MPRGPPKKEVCAEIVECMRKTKCADLTDVARGAAALLLRHRLGVRVLER